MQALVETIKAWQLHPVVDHFTVALIIIGILFDLAASLIPSRAWLGYTALSLMIIGAGAAAGSNLTGGWEAERVWHNVSGPAMDVLKRHAELGDWLPWAFLALALWRAGIQFLGFLAGSRPLYLLIAVIAGGVMLYQGHEGGELVYEYGIGTDLMPTASPTESPQAAPTPTPAEASPLPTVFNPTATPTPAAPASPEPSPSAAPSVSESSSPSAPPTSAASPSVSGGTLVNPPDGEASPAAAETPEPKNL